MPNSNWKKIVDQLVIENCLSFGGDSKFTQKKVARYLLGTRATFEIFKLYELRYLLLKVYPFIQNMFYNPRLNSTLKVKKIWNRNYHKQLEKQRKLGTRLPSNEWKPKVRIINSFVQKEKNLTPQVLFATVTPMYTDIIKAAAQICNMPSHENRWLNGSITAAISYQEDHLRWSYITDETQAQTLFHSTRKWGANKENIEKTKEKLRYHGESRWPSLIIIPDLSNNIMILKEAKKVGLPVMGLVNSSTSFQIDYPIFAQEQTLQSVHFFCHFLATLIAKEMVYIQHKRYILQKKKRKLKPRNLLKSGIKGGIPTRENKFSELKRSHLMHTKTKHKSFFRNTFFFRIVKPTTDHKMPDNEWHREYTYLPPNGKYFSPKYIKYKFRLNKKFNKRAEFISNKKVTKKKLKPLFNNAFNVRSRVKYKIFSKIRKTKKLHLFKKGFFSSRSSKKIKLNMKKKIKTYKVSKNKNGLKLQKHFKKNWTAKDLQTPRLLKIIGRYLKKKKNNVPVIKKQKYLSFMINLQRRPLAKFRSKYKWQFLQQEALKKHFRLKKKAFLMISEQRQLWAKIHNFLSYKKIVNLQKRNKFLRFRKAKFHTGYKNYYGVGLKQWRQTMRFSSPKHSFAIFLKHISYRYRLKKALYWDAHPAEWKAEKARLYKIRSEAKRSKAASKAESLKNSKNDSKKLEQNNQKKDWARWTEKNDKQKSKNKKKEQKKYKNF